MKILKYTFSNPIVLSSLALGGFIFLGMIAAVFIHSQTQLTLARQEITVKGMAYEDVIADNGQWEIGLSVTDLDRMTSLKKMEQQQKVIQDYLSKFPSFSVSVGIPTTDKRYTYENTKEIFRGYVSVIHFTVSSLDVDTLFAQASVFNRFAVENNLDVDSASTDFYYSKLDTLKVNLLKKAVEDARNRANALASSSNTKIGKVRRASQGVFQVNARNNYDVSAGGNYDTETKEKTVQSTIEITFELL